MEIPINLIYAYVGSAVMGGLTIDVLRRYIRDPNPTNLYFGLAIASATLSTASFGLPVLFTRNLKLLSVFAFVGDISLSIALLFLWIISVRALLSNKSIFSRFILFFISLTTIASMTESALRNLSIPTKVYLSLTSGGHLLVMYPQSALADRITAINSISLICVGVYFLKQIISIKNKSQRLRLKGVSFGFIIAGLNFIVTPFIKADFHTTFTAVNMTLCFLVIALMSIASIWKNKTPRKKLA